MTNPIEVAWSAHAPAPNTNPDTGIAYGYISAEALHPEVVDNLLYGAQARDHSYEEAVADIIDEAIKDFFAERGRLPDVDEELDIREDAETEAGLIEFNEPEITGQFDGVFYATSWLGGALHFWIFESPVTTDKAGRASPCVPGAGILDRLDGSVTSYDVPADWRRGDA